MTLKINTDVRADEVEEVWFGDDGPYEFTTPKVAPLLSAMRKLQSLDDDTGGMLAMDTQDQWLESGFGPDQWKRIQDRLADPNDALDTWHLVEVFEALFEQVSGRPPTLRGGSSGTSRTQASGARRSQGGSTRTISRPGGRVI